MRKRYGCTGYKRAYKRVNLGLQLIYLLWIWGMNHPSFFMISSFVAYFFFISRPLIKNPHIISHGWRKEGWKKRVVITLPSECVACGLLYILYFYIYISFFERIFNCHKLSSSKDFNRKGVLYISGHVRISIGLVRYSFLTG